MKVLECESFIAFSLPLGSRRHDTVNPGTTGVDFEINDWNPIWLEVKNWNAPVIPLYELPRVERNFIDKTLSTSSFWSDICGKVNGTHDCLSKRGETDKPPIFALLLEPPSNFSPTLAPFVSILERALARQTQVQIKGVFVVKAHDLNRICPDAAAEFCHFRALVPNACVNPINGCSARKRAHREA